MIIVTKFKKYFLIIFFITFIYLPIIGTIFDFQNGLYDPKFNELKKFPEFKECGYDIGKFCDEFFGYYEDNFGFRYNLMRFASNLKIKLFKTYPKNIDAKVLKGKDGWLFYKLGNEIEDFQGRVPLANVTLNKIISEYEDSANYLNSLGIKLYVLIPPNKSAVYSEYLPDRVIYGIKSDKTRISQLLALNSDFIYPKKELLENKGKDLLYFKTDTHWTYYGAYFGYRALMKKIQNDFDINVPELSEFKKRYTEYYTDLTRMVNVEKADSEIQPQYFCTDKIKKSNLKAMIFGDSFMAAMHPYFDCTFSSVNYSERGNFDVNKIAKAKPDIVIIEIVQRDLKYMFD